MGQSPVDIGDILAAVRERRIGADTALRWLEMRLAGQRRAGPFAVDASGPLRAARYGTASASDEYEMLFSAPEEADRYREYEILFPAPEEAADRYWAARVSAAAQAADYTDDELYEILFGNG